ncbi:MAG: mutarotase [Saprospiraceae bacterium]|nr:mutarotase [Saprospiraceae bacterium]
MDLKAHYDKLWQESLSTIQMDNFQVDKHLHDPTDDRFGITLLARPNVAVRQSVQKLLVDLHSIDPQQYYYPESDLHITVLSIISCQSGFSLKQIEVAAYIRLIAQSLTDIPPFTIDFHGITASPSSVILQGFYTTGTLDLIRDRLRQTFKSSDLTQSINKRYKLQTAHSTVVRFAHSVEKRDELLAILEEYRSFSFGSTQVEELEFVFNDWYQRAKKTNVLARFPLAAPGPVLSI